jgi:hypothetical protein
VKRAYAFPLMPIHYFSGSFILANFSHPLAGLISLCLFADWDNHRMGDGTEDLTFSGLYVVGIPQQLTSSYFQNYFLYE